MKALLIALLMLVPSMALANGKGGNAAAAAAAQATGVGVGVGIAGGNSTSVSTTTKADAEPAIAPNIALTSSGCLGSVGFGVGGGGVVSLGMGTTVANDDCQKMELAKIYFATGNTAMANRLLESTSYVKEIMERDTAARARVLAREVKKSDDLGCLVNPSLARSMGINC